MGTAGPPQPCRAAAPEAASCSGNGLVSSARGLLPGRVEWRSLVLQD